IEDSKAKLNSLGNEGMAARLAEGGEVSAPLAAAFANGVEPEDPANDALLARHHAWIAKMWDLACPPEAYAGLADLYLAHPDFRTEFDRSGDGLLAWMTAAMKAYAARLAAQLLTTTRSSGSRLRKVSATPVAISSCPR